MERTVTWIRWLVNRNQNLCDTKNGWFSSFNLKLRGKTKKIEVEKYEILEKYKNSEFYKSLDFRNLSDFSNSLIFSTIFTFIYQRENSARKPIGKPSSWHLMLNLDTYNLFAFHYITFQARNYNSTLNMRDVRNTVNTVIMNNYRSLWWRERRQTKNIERLIDWFSTESDYENVKSENAKGKFLKGVCNPPCKQQF